VTDTPGDDAAAVQAPVVDAEAVEAQADPAGALDDAVNTEAVNDEPGAAEVAAAPAAAPSDAPPQTNPDAVLAAERLGDLQRLQAEYVNYKRRVDRDRAAMQERAVRDVLESVLPVLDDIQAARVHGDLADGPFAAIADKLEATLGRFGLARYGAIGEVFDPMEHEALMHVPWDQSHRDSPDLPDDAGATLVVLVLQPGYRAGDQVLRPARVAVADPE
jgi:molecular chaperone GrpE